ncbi:dihydroorotase [Niastella yeongjuensis]|uniref:Dihydroorotase n=1 Tax=Niastella yeongjuensis TaxID=354355 RepID=A0A1V9EN51_9BACT|nr:dihydroorotase [Niastella yeongjuensis]OQP47557.1 dihydroorotase [Niastella yeongjuensis]
MQNYLIKNIMVVNEGVSAVKDVLIKNGRIEKIDGNIQPDILVTEINGQGLHLLPGAIDDQVHFREPGLTHKASIYTESKAAVAGGVTSFMEMPNTMPPVFTQQLLEDKYVIGANSALANYSFYMGTSNDNVEEVLKTNDRKKDICGIKIFMGSSTGGLLVDNYLTLDKIFQESEVLIATHCEDEKIIKANYERIKKEKGTLDPADHPRIRDEYGCFESSLVAIQFAQKYNTRLHILHITTEKELALFSNMRPLEQKNITAEVCVHHLHFTSNDYDTLGNLIKCNPAIKAPHNREALWQALLDDRLDVIATDHAPHTLEEKGVQRNAAGLLTLPPVEPGSYEKSHAGLPLVQHSLLLMLHYVKEGRITIEKVVEKMSHAVAKCYQIADRGYIREGYKADLVIVNINATTTATKENILYKCGWSPLEQFTFPAAITHTFVNGNLVYGNGQWNESNKGERLLFNR